jgi:glycerophosphoryl diester phosphodiesterase
MKYLGLYLVGLLPFIKIDHHEVAAFPYMTRDYVRMKLVEAREKSAFYYAFILVVVFSNRYLHGMIEHLARRGLHTNYWVVNDEDELRAVVRTGPIQGVMSDRPSEAMRVVRQETDAAALREAQAAQAEARTHTVRIIIG